MCLSIIDDEVICVNVGDSRCMAGYCTSDNQILPIPLSLDQTPFRDVVNDSILNCRMNGKEWKHVVRMSAHCQRKSLPRRI